MLPMSLDKVLPMLVLTVGIAPYAIRMPLRGEFHLICRFATASPRRGSLFAAAGRGMSEFLFFDADGFELADEGLQGVHNMGADIAAD